MEKNICSKTREEQLRGLIDKLEVPIKNMQLLNCALTHTSYANESRNNNIHHNERLEFLGDAVLDLIVGSYLFLNYPQMTEGELTRAKAAVVCEPSLAKCSRDLGYGNYLRLGKGELNSGGRKRPSILADTFEAVIGAIYLDTDYEETEKFVLSHLKKPLEKVGLGHYDDDDFKTLLQEYVQRDGEQHIEYRLVYSAGPDHDKTFGMEVLVNDVVYGSGIGKSKKDAEQHAADVAYHFLVERDKKSNK